MDFESHWSINSLFFFHLLAFLPHRGVTLVRDNSIFTWALNVLLMEKNKVFDSISTVWLHLSAGARRAAPGRAHAEHLSSTTPVRKRVNKLILLHLISPRPPIHHSQTWISLMDNKVLGSHAGARVRIRFSNYSRLFSCNLTETDRSRRSGSEALVFVNSRSCLGSIAGRVSPTWSPQRDLRCHPEVWSMACQSNELILRGARKRRDTSIVNSMNHSKLYYVAYLALCFTASCFVGPLI